NLCHLLTRAHAHTRASDGGRIILAPSVPIEAVLARPEGLVCLSGCARQGVRDEPTLRRLLDAFGPDGLRVELQRPFGRHDRALNRGLESLARRLGVACVATGNVHAHSRERALLQDAFVAIREHATLDASEPLRRGNHSHVMATPAAMAARFADHPDAVTETLRLAERLRFDLCSDLGYRYPGAEDEGADQELAAICRDKFDWRYPSGHRCRSEALGRLDEELRVIRKLGLSGFFILHRDLLELAREVAAEVRGPAIARAMLPPGRGRGSSVSSIVCYLTGLSHIDPIENELFLGRFLNEELTALPDIDLDFPRDIRAELIPRVHQRYGNEHSALVAAFPTYRSRGAIREIGKALGLPPGEIERVARVAEPWAQSVEEDVELALGAAAQAAEGTHSARAAAAASVAGADEYVGYPGGSRAARHDARAQRAEDAAREAGQAHTAKALAAGNGPSPVGPPPWTPAAGLAAVTALGVATNRFGGPDAAVNGPLASGLAGPNGFHDAHGDTRSRAAREAALRASDAAQAFEYDRHGDKDWDWHAERAAGRAGQGRRGSEDEVRWRAERDRSATARPAPEDAGQRSPAGRWGWLSRLAGEAYGLPRHLSQHPGGMIVSTRPLIDCVPLVPAAMEGRQMCHWDKDSCADAGFLKIDLLGLGMLSAVERCVEEVARTRCEQLDLSRIAYDDKPTYAAIQTADTMGVFQIESRAQMQSLLRTRPETLDDLTIQVAIVRPGPIVGGAVNPYIERKQKLREDPSFEVPYDHPSLEPVLKDTLGTIIFQDQVLEVAMAFAGFSPGEAEGLRRAMSRKRSAAAIEGYHERFVAGAALTHGADRETAERIFTMIAGFSGFGFPKAHGAAFGLLAYQSTWLRVHYKPEFTCALLNEQPMGFYPSDTLIHECQRTGIEVLPPDVNHSDVLCRVEALGEQPIIRVGLGYLNGARADEVAAIVAERERAGPFTSLGELASRSGAGRPALSVLAWSGSCDSLLAAGAGLTEHTRRQALWQLGIAAPATKSSEGAQLALPLDLPDAPELKPLAAWERMVADYATTGVTAGAHPMALVRDDLPADVVHSGDLGQLRHGVRVRIGGLVVARQRPATAGGIVFMLLEDEHGTINLVVPPVTYDRDRLVVRGEPLVFAEGRLEKHPKAAGAINIVVDSLRPLDTSRNGSAAAVIPLLATTPGAPDAQADAEPVDPWAPAAAASGGRRGRDFAAVAPPVQSFGQGRR
ncbi:MAG: error-prone polymerase, partial [Solirubrobacteraceae bacterium]|nr:error-prone polymerase [Solirubrobacteraceae bacterium]